MAKPKGKVTYHPMVPLLTMVENGLSECLSHKLCEVLLERKWINYGLPIFAVTTSFYFLYLFLLTLLIVTCYNSEAVSQRTVRAYKMSTSSLIFTFNFTVLNKAF